MVRYVRGAVLEFDQRVIARIQIIRAVHGERRHVARPAVGVADGGRAGWRVVEIGIVVVHLVVGTARIAQAIVQHRVFQLVFAAGHEDLVVNGFLFIAQGLVEAIGAHAVGKAAGGGDRRAVRRHGQPLALNRFGVAGVEAADVIAVARIRLEAQVDADAVAAAVILVPALVPAGVGQRGMDAVVEEGRFDVVDAAFVLVISRRDDDRESMVRIDRCAAFIGVAGAEAGAGGERQVGDVGAAQRFAAGADARFKEGLAVARRGLRRDFNRAAQRFGILLRKIGFGHRNGADQAGGNRVQRHRAAAAERRGVVRRRQPQAAEGRAVEIGVEAANIDEASLAGIGLQRDAGYAPHRLGDVHIRQLAHLRRRHQVDQVGRLLLRLPGIGVGRALGIHHDHLDGVAGRRWISRIGRVGRHQEQLADESGKDGVLERSGLHTCFH